MRIRINIAVLLVFAAFWQHINAQSALSSAGGNAFRSQGSLCYTVGQLNYLSYQSNYGISFLGVQHPFELSVTTNIKPSKDLSISANVFPNPTSGFINLRVYYDEFVNTSYKLVDSKGITIYSKKVISPLTTIDLSKLPSGLYLLKVSDNNGNLKSFKILKSED